MVRTAMRTLGGVVVWLAGGEFGMAVMDVARADKSVRRRLKSDKNGLMMPQAANPCGAPRQ
jgi:hypothetical protein